MLGDFKNKIFKRLRLAFFGFTFVYVAVLPLAYWSLPHMNQERKDCLVANDMGRFWSACSNEKAANDFRYRVGENLQVPYFEFFKNEIL